MTYARRPMTEWTIAMLDSREDRVRDVLELLRKEQLAKALVVISKAQGYKYFAPDQYRTSINHKSLYAHVIEQNWALASQELQVSQQVWFHAVLTMIGERSAVDAKRRGFDLSEDGCLFALNRERAEAALASSEDERADELADVALVCLTAIHLGYGAMPNWVDMISPRSLGAYGSELVKALHGIEALGDFWMSRLSGKLRYNETRGPTLTP